jgi:hypothetical protein
MQALQLAFCQHTPMPPRQISQPKISDSKTEKMFDAIPNGLEHPANLPIDSLS